MFWNKKITPPVTDEDRMWVEESLLMLGKEFGKEYFREIFTVLPNKSFYNHDFKGEETDAEFVLNQTRLYMDIETNQFELEFYSDEPVEMSDGSILSTPANIYGNWKSAAGIYEETTGSTKIYIERSLLKDPAALIATMAHELAHHILLGEGRIEANDEYLTDLVAISYGFGIFLGNTRCRYSTSSRGWSMSSTGYLPEQVVAYAMAWLCIYRNEKPVWKNMLNNPMLTYFEQSLKFINKFPEEIRFE